MSEGFFHEGAVGGPGRWTDERLAKIPEYKFRAIELVRSGLFLSEISDEMNIAQRTFRKWRAEDQEFREAWADAEASVNDTLEKEAIRRARDGVLEPLVSKGQVVMVDGEVQQVRRYSDALLQFLLKGRRREVYGDHQKVDSTLTLDVAGSKARLEERFANLARPVPALPAPAE